MNIIRGGIICRISFIFLILLSFTRSYAREGMWLPYLIGQLNADEMQRMGLQISAEDIYSVNNSSIKDAIVHFGGGCTAELISDQGLLLTNHHCGYGQIQSHSSLENDYLKDGFWAMSGKEELKNPGLTAAIVKYMEDVTNAVLEGVNEDMSLEERGQMIRTNIKNIIDERNSDYELEILPFFYGNQYILIAKEVFKDVRLVGAPPSSIGKFGADTDNWVWPRHTGDFSLFRVYANAENKPAEPSEENVPYRPLQHLKVNIGGIKTGDFTMIYGFPGTTYEYLPSNEVQTIIDLYDPTRIDIREARLEILDEKMRQDDATRIKYASKYARISNAWKKWIGEILGLTRTDAVAKKEAMEKELQAAIDANPQLKEKYGELLPQLKKLYDERKPMLLERHIYVETQYFGSEIVNHMLSYRGLVAAYSGSDSAAFREASGKKAEAIAGFYKDYDAELDQKTMKALLPVYLENINTQPVPEYLQELKGMSGTELNNWIDSLFAKSVVVNHQEEWAEMLKAEPYAAMDSMMNSREWQLAMGGWDHFVKALDPKLDDYTYQINALQKDYLAAMQEAFPEKRLYPDANGTLRLTYGKVQGYEPMDGVTYIPQTFLSGVMEKYQPGDYEFDVPEKLIELYEQKDYGRYGQDGKMPVCFIASNHTTGGNSGSPALNARGELIGLNFDRTWEGTMSDYNYDISLCRNIMVDARYILFIIDKFAGAGYLVEEMDLVTEPATKLPEGKKDRRQKVKQ